MTSSMYSEGEVNGRLGFDGIQRSVDDIDNYVEVYDTPNPEAGLVAIREIANKMAGVAHALGVDIRDNASAFRTILADWEQKRFIAVDVTRVYSAENGDLFRRVEITLSNNMKISVRLCFRKSVDDEKTYNLVFEGADPNINLGDLTYQTSENQTRVYCSDQGALEKRPTLSEAIQQIANMIDGSIERNPVDILQRDLSTHDELREVLSGTLFVDAAKDAVIQVIPGNKDQQNGGDVLVKIHSLQVQLKNARQRVLGRFEDLHEFLRLPELLAQKMWPSTEVD